MSSASPADQPPEVLRARRPQWLVLMLFSVAVYDRPAAISAGSVIDILAKLAVGSAAVRSTLGRMSERGLLQRHPKGREMYYALTERGHRVLQEGQALALEPVDQPWDGLWTILAVSLPDRHQALRYRVRSRLAWEGFGQLQNGLWVSPHQPDVTTALQGLDVLDHVHVFTGARVEGTPVAELIRKLYDLDEMAARYTGFLERWTRDPVDEFDDEISALLVLLSEWAQIVRADPRLPLAHLPDPWPATEADRLFRRHYDHLMPRVAQAAKANLRILELSTENA
ncbi:PaaX family transcriptional regulator [Streptomyces coffeae]|uniref:PaaX family transcriptional regulator n=1 Tax=Streptomyces coffeae TaxID=621382 RepID=A0ABS1NKT1_9ACTN|nr:PaaX family transcriptional regulator C-terminal domain-containing protein [Streptomyces coffeae]MBL1100560.1 PaaX family transcriptional regulator [Streptomyces coffeae]